MKDRIYKAKRWLKKSLRLKIIAMAIIPVFFVQVAVGAVTYFAYRRVTTKLVSNRDLRLARLTYVCKRVRSQGPQSRFASGSSSGLDFRLIYSRSLDTM